jgi:pilus assembly protein Flp/PilA
VSHFKKFSTKLWRDESGATAIEYGLLAALIAVAIITTVSTLGGRLDATFDSVDDDLAAEGIAAAAD